MANLIINPNHVKLGEAHCVHPTLLIQLTPSVPGLVCVMGYDSHKWITPAQARRLAKEVLRLADRAEAAKEKKP